METDTDVKYGSMASYDGATPRSKTSYVFKGWYKEGDDSKTLVTDFMVTEDATYIAVFELTDSVLTDSVKYSVLTKPNGDSYAVVPSLNDTSLTDIEISSTYNGVPVTSIAAKAFSNTYIESIKIPDSVTTIGEYAFAGCQKLSSVTLPDSLTTIEEGTFYSCDNLSSVTLPEGLTKLSYGLFAYCNNLKTLTLPSTLTKIDTYSFYGSGLTSIEIPEGVASLDSSAFSSCDDLRSVSLPSTLKTIDSYCFSNCSSLTSIDIPDGVTDINSLAFEGCTKLTSISLPKTLTGISDSAFSGCSSLEKVIIPASVTSIGSIAFKDTYCNFYLEAASIPSGWSSDWNAGAYGSIVYYSETPNTDGSHWHYDSDGKTPILWK